jgi:hypothetical protein
MSSADLFQRQCCRRRSLPFPSEIPGARLSLYVLCFHLLSSANPSGNTLDIAIWSSVEQGLAITAGSLATLRPLLKLAGHHLGFTSGPTAYNLSTPGAQRYGHRSTPSRHDLELSPVPPPKDTDVFSSRMRDNKRGTQTRLTPVGENESMEELHSPRSYFKTDDR